MSDKDRIRDAVARYTDREGIPPTIAEVASNVSMTVTHVYETAEAEGSGLSVAWSGPRPRGISGMLLEVDDGT